MKNNEEKSVRVNSLRAWLLAARPVTLTCAMVPVLVGAASVWSQEGDVRWLPVLLCLFFAWIMQIDANFVNDYFDFRKGNDDVSTRLGPLRSCSMGWVTPSAMKKAIVLTTLGACLVGFPLVFFGGWWLVGVGLCCVVACFLYTTWLSYRGLGDVLVVVFFGWVPVVLTAWMALPSGGVLNPSVWIDATACGLVIDGLLMVNNYRDIDNDRLAGKLTLAVRLGRRWSGVVYLLLGVSACLLVTLSCHLRGLGWASVPVWLIFLPLHIQAWRSLVRIGQGRALNVILGKTSRNIVVYGLMVVISEVLLRYLLR